MKAYSYFAPFVLFLLCITSACSDDNDNDGRSENRITTDEIYYANKFARSVISDIYLWKDEIGTENIAKLDPDVNEDPISTVESIRYKENGAKVDKWTMLTDDWDSFTNSMDGVSTTYGYLLQLSKFINSGTYFFTVCFVYDGSPAQKAGLKRGDIIMQMNGHDITESNYLDALTTANITLNMAVVGEDGKISLNGENVALTAVEMYKNPIACAKTFDCGDKKVGYLHYESFDAASLPQLIEVCRNFKSEGISELILDMRYNGGGYVLSELVLASMLAPEKAVNNKEVYETEIWNDDYMDYFKSRGTDLNTYFSTKFVNDIVSPSTTLSTQDVNIGLNKIYALISSSTASAAESILIGLMPYMPIEIIGRNSHGKYCTGMLMGTSDYEGSKYINNWGIYVMCNRYADKNGNNSCMPDGLVPDIKIVDNPRDGYQLGDEGETLLRVALSQAGKTDLAPAVRNASSMPVYESKNIHTDPRFGMRIDNNLLEKIKKHGGK